MMARGHTAAHASREEPVLAADGDGTDGPFAAIVVAGDTTLLKNAAPRLSLIEEEVARLRDSQLGSEKVHDIQNYIVPGKLWRAFESEGGAMLLLDDLACRIEYTDVALAVAEVDPDGHGRVGRGSVANGQPPCGP